MELPDFDCLRSLADENPDELEKLRQMFCEKIIADAPDRYKNRLKGLQFQIDMIKRRSKNPLHCCIEISRMMMDNCFSMQQAIEGIGDPAEVSYVNRPHYIDNVIYLND